MPAPMTTPRDLPAVSSTVPFEVRYPLSRVREELQRLIGTIGVDKLDQAITWRHAITQGWVASPPTGNFVGGTGGGGIGGGGGTSPPDLTPPPTPTGFSATGGFSSVILQWAAPVYTQGHGHGQTNVYGVQRPIPDPSPPPVLGDAALVTTAYGRTTITSMPSELNTHWHLWIKWQSVDGVESAAAAGGTNGFQVETGQDVAQLLQVLTGKITQSQLFSTLGARIDLIDAADSIAGSVAQRIKVERDRALGAEAIIVGDVDALELTVNNASTGVVATANALDTVELLVNHSTQGNVALASRASSLETTVNHPSTGVAATASALDTVELLVNHASQGNVALASRASSLETTVNDGTNGVAATAAALDTVELIVNHASSGNSALATRTNTLEVALNTPTTGNNPTYAALQNEATVRANADGQLQGQWTVKIDLNGYVTGFGLASTAGNAAPTSSFIIRAGDFSVASPSGPGITPIVPFTVVTVATTLNGVPVPVGIYADAAFFLNGSIVNAKIANLAVDDAKISAVSVAKLIAGSIGVGEYIQSTGYSAGTAGFRISGNGDAEFNNIVARGTIFASAGTIGGITIGSNYVQSSDYVLGTSGWRLTPTSAQLPATTIIGTLTTSQLASGAVTDADEAAIDISSAGSLTYADATGQQSFTSTMDVQASSLSGHSILVVASGSFHVDTMTNASAQTMEFLAVLEELNSGGAVVTQVAWSSSRCTRHADGFAAPFSLTYPKLGKSGFARYRVKFYSTIRGADTVTLQSPGPTTGTAPALTIPTASWYGNIGLIENKR